MILRMTEEHQDESYVSELAAAFAAEGEYDALPIVAIDSGEIIDGHHRYRAAVEAGVEPYVVTITETACEALEAEGFDRMEIACAALLAAGEYDAADYIDAQFGGIVMARAEKAEELL